MDLDQPAGRGPQQAPSATLRLPGRRLPPAAAAGLGLGLLVLLAGGAALRLSDRVRRDQLEIEALRRRADALRDSVRSLRELAQWSGSARPVVLRDAAGPSPLLRLDPDAPLQPLLVVHDLMALQQDPAGRWMLLRVVRITDGAEVWRRPESLRHLWDPGLGALVVLVPRAALQEPSAYRFEILEAGAPLSRFAAEFVVVPPG